MLPESFHLECRYYYHRLNDSEKRFYEFLVERIMNLELEFILQYDDIDLDYMPEDKRNLPKFLYHWTGEIEPFDIYNTYQYLLYDCPEFYYVNNCRMRQNLCGTIDIGLGKPEYSAAEIKEFNRRIDEIYDKFKHIEDDFEYEVAVHDYIVDTFSYDNEGRENKRIGLPFLEMFTVVGFFKRGVAVCAAYSGLMQILLQRRGIPCAYLIADAGDEGSKESHAWLAVKLDDSYYHLDITFDDHDDNESPRHESFNVTDEEIISSGHEFRSESYPGIVCNETKYNYYRRRGLYYDTQEELRVGAETFVKEHSWCGKRQCFIFKTNKAITSEEVMNVVGTACIKFVTDFDGYLYDNSVYSFTMDFRPPEQKPKK